MLKKGFTLFELLIIILILSLIGGAGIVVFVNTLKSSQTNQYNMITNQIVDASKVFVETNEEKISELNTTGYINIKIGDLQEAGFVDWNLINPITNEQISSTYYVSAVKNPNSTIIYNYHEENLSPVGRPTDPPTITLNGDSSIYICNGVYNELGAHAESVIEGDISYKIEISGFLDPETTGTYELTYSVTDINGLSSSVVRTVIVSYEAPVIILNGSSSVTVTTGVYDDPGASANSCPDGDLTSSIVVSGTVSLPNQGTYVRTYTITDSTGQTSFVTRTINATDTTIPNVSFGTNGSSTYAKSRSTSVTVTDPTAPTATYSGVNASSLKYLWSTSTSTPSEGSFSTTFTNGGTLSVSGVTGDYYLWILAKDNAGNTRIIRTNVFKLDNTPPPAPSIARSPGSWTTGNVTLTPSCGADGHSGVSSCCYWNGSSCISASYIGKAKGTKTFASVDAAGNISTNTASVSSRTEYQYTDKYFNFNGSSYMRSTTAGIYGILVNDGASQFIFEAGIYLYSKSSNFYFFDAADSGGTPRFALWYRASDSTLRVYSKYSSTVYINTGYSYNFALNTYYTVKVEGGTDSSRGYAVSVNGSTIGTTGSSYRFADSGQYTYVGRRYTAADYMNGRMYYFFFQGRKSDVASVAYNYCSYNYYGAAYVNPYNPSNFTEIGDANYRFNFTGITVGGSPSGWSTTDPGSNCYRYRETRTTYY